MIIGSEFFEWSRVSPPNCHAQLKGERYTGPSEVRFVRFRFGSCAESGLGSQINALTVIGRPFEKKQPWAPSPIMSSTGRHLVFATCPEEHSNVEVYLIDSTVSMHASEDDRFVLHLHYAEKDLLQTSIICNGHKILFWNRNEYLERKDGEGSVEYTAMVYDLDSGKKLRQSLSSFNYASSRGFPCTLEYDARNNMIWGFDDQHLQMFRWRNIGVVPHFNPERPRYDNKLLFSSSPVYRLEALRKLPTETLDLDSTAEAAVLLCHLDRLSLQYGPPMHSAAEISLIDEVEVTCRSDDRKSHQEKSCRILIRGQLVLGSEEGINVVVLDEDYKPTGLTVFSTGANEMENDHFATFVENLEEGSIVLVGVTGDGARGLTSRGRSALRALGATDEVRHLFLLN